MLDKADDDMMRERQHACGQTKVLAQFEKEFRLRLSEVVRYENDSEGDTK